MTNDHFDTDGLLAIWALLNPEEALRHERALKDAAEAGDFYHFTSPAGVQFDFIIRAFEDPEQSPLGRSMSALSYAGRSQLATDTLLLELPGLLYDTHRHRELWERPYQRLMKQLQLINDQTAIVREWPAERFSVVICPSPLDHYARNVFAAGHRILEANPTRLGTHYQLFYREYLWYEIVSRPTSPRHVLTDCANRLNALERNDTDGTWGVTEWSPALRFVEGERCANCTVSRRDPPGHSRLPVHTVEGVVREELDRLDRRGSDENRGN